jgi:hypothetical protein
MRLLSLILALACTAAATWLSQFYARGPQSPLSSMLAATGSLTFIILAWGFWSSRHAPSGRRLDNTPPSPADGSRETPAEASWRRRFDWTAGYVDGNTAYGVRAAWNLTAFWNLVSAPLLVVVPTALATQKLAAIGLLFPCVGVGLIVWATLATVRWRRFGTPRIELRPIPVAPGDTLNAVLCIDRAPSTLGTEPLSLRAALTCLRRSTSRHRSDSDTTERILWQEERDLDATAAQRGDGSISLPFAWTIPGDAAATTTVDGTDGVFWSLTIRGAFSGVDFKDDFDIPVFGAPRATTHEAAREQRVDTSTAALTGTGIELRPLPAGTEYRFAAARNVSFALGVTVFTMLWSAALWLQVALDFPLIFVLLTGLVDLLLVAVVLDLWAGASCVAIDGTSVVVTRSLLGLRRSRTLDAAQIVAIETKVTMQSHGRWGTPYYAILARTPAARHVEFARGIRGRARAEGLAAHMRASVKLKASAV